MGDVSSRLAQKNARPYPGRALEVRMRQTLRINAAFLWMSTVAAATGAESSPPLCNRRGSKDSTSVLISKAVVATAASPETTVLIRGDISMFMIVLLRVVIRCGSDPERKSALVLSSTRHRREDDEATENSSFPHQVRPV